MFLHDAIFFSFFFLHLLITVGINILIFLGETGIGKSTLMNTLFNTIFETEEASHYEHIVRLRPQTYDLQESNVHLKLTIVDAVGFGDQINKDERQVTFQFGPEAYALF